MAQSVSLVLRLDTSVVDLATVAYLRDLVEALQRKCFHLACANQIAGDVTSDLFHLRPEPFLLPGVPDVIASAINKLEELLRRGSPALAAYGRHVIRLKRARQDGVLSAAMAELQSVDDVIVNQYDVFDATMAQLLATQYAKQRLINQIAAVVFSPAVGERGRVAALISLLPRLGEAHEREAELEMALRRMILKFVTLSWHLEVAKALVEVIPHVSGDWADDVQIICDGTARFEESASMSSWRS